jgi:TPR repeat protein
LYREAAELGYSPAAYALGCRYCQGFPGEEDPDEEEGVHWLCLAAEGDSLAQYELAKIFFHRPSEEDKKEALEWLELAADQGLPEAQYDYAQILLKGEHGLAKDVAESLKWHTKAAKQGHARAQYQLGRWYDQGLPGILPQDAFKASCWVLKAANLGRPVAQYAIAMRYLRGEGVEAVDKTEAVKRL